MLKSLSYIPVLVFTVLLAAACGYHFTGGGGLPGGIQTLQIEMFRNRTAETGLETLVTNDLIYEFTRNGKISIVDGQNADARLTGVIKVLSIATISHRGKSTSNERRVKIGVDMKLVDPQGEVLWEGKNLSEQEEYKVSSSKTVTESNRSAAIETLSRRFAEKVYSRMTDDF